jgi:biotin carboxylase
VPRILLLATTTGYQTRAFGDAAERLGVELVFATDRCHMIEDPWQDGAIAIRFYDEDGSVDTILSATRERPLDGVLVVGDRPTVIAARVSEGLGLAGHPPAAAATARNKQLTRERLSAARMPTPWFRKFAIDADVSRIADSVSFPCIVKPIALSGSRGVIRADDPATLVSAVARLRALLRSPDIRAERDPAHSVVLVEQFIPGREYAVEGLMHHGDFRLLALFDKPDPLDGPFFEETIYVTPSREPRHVQHAVEEAVARAARTIGLHHGPIHAECRVNEHGVYVLEVAARPIGGLCARTLRFERGVVPFEELLLRHALGESPDAWVRESDASGVMMIPIPARGVFRGVEGIDEARAVECVHDVRITAKPDQVLVPLPEGASYLGFIFARAPEPARVEQALRTAHTRLRFAIEPELQVVQSRHG